jgi:hypothetical protein
LRLSKTNGITTLPRGLVSPLTLIYGKADGLLIGLGLEYAFTNNWTTKFEFPLLGVTRKTFAHTEFFSV